MSYLGWFDGELRPDAWFDAELQPAAWFDTEIVNTSTAGNTAVNLGVGSLSITGYAPTVTQALAAGYSFAAIHEYRDNGSISVTSWIPLNHLTAQGANASYVVRGSQGINSWSYVVPTAAGVVDTPINPGVGSITITGYAPTIAQGANQSILPAVGSLTIMGYAPTLAQTANQSVLPSAGSLAITGYAPSVSQPHSVAPAAGIIAITGYAPTVTQATSSSYGVVHSYVSRGSQVIVSWLNDGLGAATGAIFPAAGNLTLSGHAPTVAQSANQAVAPGVGNLTITGYAPTVAQAVNQSISPAAGTLALTGYAPTISQTANVSLVPGAGSIAITGYAPTVAQSSAVELAPGAGSLTITGYAPSISQTADAAWVGVVHSYVGRGSVQVVSWLNDGLSIPVTPDAGTPSYSAEIEMSRGHWYVRRGKRIYLFSSAEDADNWLDADRIAQEAVEAAQRSSRRARKRLKDKVLKTYEAPKAEVIDGGLIEAMALRYGLDFDLASLIQQRDIEQIIAMQALAWQMQDDEDIELLLLA